MKDKSVGDGLGRIISVRDHFGDGIISGPVQYHFSLKVSLVAFYLEKEAHSKVLEEAEEMKRRVQEVATPGRRVNQNDDESNRKPLEKNKSQFSDLFIVHKKQQDEAQPRAQPQTAKPVEVCARVTGM